ncbi:hypothetical protein PGT21_014040 [Puccinia graminis f. sp. tritici]|uniref:Uncharacterized protein n=1 Tax=Puccinia graminis f. sp. tritici TaxID=56615 RepID=A0A5B0P9C7_PUCGR|nr:hypothetical protein PGT21_014040 [Puccinia graminis f. sp. tritici]
MQSSQHVGAPGSMAINPSLYADGYSDGPQGPQPFYQGPGPQQASLGYGPMRHELLDPQYHPPNQLSTQHRPTQGYLPGSQPALCNQPTERYAPGSQLAPHNQLNERYAPGDQLQHNTQHSSSRDNPASQPIHNQQQQTPFLANLRGRTHQSLQSTPHTGLRIPLRNMGSAASHINDAPPTNINNTQQSCSSTGGAGGVGSATSLNQSNSNEVDSDPSRDDFPIHEPLSLSNPTNLHSTSPIDPDPDSNSGAGPISTAAAKKQLTPDDVMEEFKKKTLSELRDLQRTHIPYKKLDLTTKIAAQNLYFKYQTKQHLLSLKHRRPFKAITKYLGQRRTRQKKSKWHSFMKTDPLAQEALHNTDNNIGQRNKEAAKIYNQLNPITSAGPSGSANPQVAFDPNADPNADERDRFGKIFKSDKALQQEVKGWAEGVQLKLKELSDSFGVEGFLVLAGQDHRKPMFFQGGSFIGDKYLRALIADNNPMRKFALWTAGSKGTSKKRKASSAVPTADNGAVEPSHKKTKHAVAAFENRDVCRGTLAANQKYISEELGKMMSK